MLLAVGEARRAEPTVEVLRPSLPRQRQVHPSEAIHPCLAKTGIVHLPLTRQCRDLDHLPWAPPFGLHPRLKASVRYAAKDRIPETKDQTRLYKMNLNIIPVEWTDEGVRMLDQRLLPTEETWLTLRTYNDVAAGIKDMVVRGAPAIGVSAAYGIALGAKQFVGTNIDDLEDELDYICDVLGATRPTAVNLFWAIDRMKLTFRRAKSEGKSISEIQQILIDEAKAIHDEDIESQRLIAKFGGELLDDNSTVLTHCNAGALATGGVWGTALGVIRGAIDQGKHISVIADETRPYLQGARLTAWELMQDDIPVTLITDNMSGHMMKKGGVQAVVVGSDRIAANGDVANKIGTYMVAVLARRHGIPFYVAAPLSTVDLNCPTGDDIPIEEREPREITHVRDIQLAPEGIGVSNYAFDVTPNELVTAIITEKGVARAPYTESLKKQFEE